MTPPRTQKPSGAELAAKLAGTNFPTAAPAIETSAPEPKALAKAKGGRPSKGGGPDAIPVNVRLSPEDHSALGKIASEIHTPGRPVPTVQDVLRRLVRGALNDPDTLNRLVKEGEI